MTQSKNDAVIALITQFSEHIGGFRGLHLYLGDRHRYSPEPQSRIEG